MSPTQKIFFALLLVFFIPLYFFRLNQTPEFKIPEDTLVRLRGRITSQPYLKGSNQIIVLGPIIIKTARFPGYFYGQRLEIVGRFQKRVLNPFQTQFFTFYPTIHLLENDQNLSQMTVFRQILLNIRGRFEKAIDQLLSEPQSSLLNGILWGAKKEMPQDFWQQLRTTGTLHIVVASGQNVTMVAWFLIEGLVWLMSRRKALFVAILGMIVYVLMVGAEAPVVRAGIMAFLAYIAQVLGRQEQATIALLIAASLMLLISPLILFDIGFQLSFAATAGLIWLYPMLIGGEKQKRKVIFRVPVFGVGLATTLAAQLGVMPILLANFGQISVLSPLINALVLWVAPIVMALGVIMATLALLINPLAWVLSWFVWLLLSYFVKVIEIVGSFPWASFELGKLSFWWAFGYYFLLALLTFRHTYLRRSSSIGQARIKNERDSVA